MTGGPGSRAAATAMAPTEGSLSSKVGGRQIVVDPDHGQAGGLVDPTNGPAWRVPSGSMAVIDLAPARARAESTMMPPDSATRPVVDETPCVPPDAQGHRRRTHGVHHGVDVPPSGGVQAGLGGRFSDQWLLPCRGRGCPIPLPCMTMTRPAATSPATRHARSRR